ncbi:MAG: hypothetical protein UW63_C0061G0004 [Candidatus Uhrbacteria bacterium GW2011_GWF2_44_350]|uniref:Uncharacterized protein n=1 Tax=Candidatus Uhrbacteria bacterium GW2011_GWF2_44_350 TaxID=1619000 RepID=A0A0G1LKI9_9BACT|nr:MAG: hypothetical protein UW63_C0061G0004 [Candidatus Uhrbacteria bacterium GW2011_GWF2_44_350]HBR80613.1 hypothetical protein [Candidatus Uhrbacteria bacterium]HCU31725.1 hypothetical protein [Candidatus Uhrbacteria bacterium]
MKKIIAILLGFSLLSGASFCLATDYRAGTDDYLVAGGLTEEQLTNNVSTENREPFTSTSGETSVSDPTGDVLSNSGTHPQINYGWADLTSASLEKNSKNQCWLFNMGVAEEIPTNAPWQANFLLYIDRDGDTTNNAPQGVRINTDYEISVKFGSENQNEAPYWFIDMRWYNPEPNFWAINKETTSTFKFDGKNLNICVPFEEISEDTTPAWRAAAVVSNGQATQVDIAPGTGFPPPSGEFYTTWNTGTTSTNLHNLINWTALEIVGGLILLIVVIKLIFRFIKRKPTAV